MSVFYQLSIFLLFVNFSNINAQDDFNDIVQQKTRGNQIQQCPCVIHPESRQCVSYDSRYVAVNAEEAILSFLDLSKHHSGPAQLINSNTFNCVTDECRACYSLLYHKLTDIGFVAQSYQSAIDLLPINRIRAGLCRRFNFPLSLPILPPPSVIPTYLRSLISAGRQFRQSRSSIIAARRNNIRNGISQMRSNFGGGRNRMNQNQNQNSNNFNNNPITNSNRNQNQNQNQNQFQNQQTRFPRPIQRFQQAVQSRFQQPPQVWQQPQWHQPQQWSQQQQPQQQFQPQPAWGASAGASGLGGFGSPFGGNAGFGGGFGGGGWGGNNQQQGGFFGGFRGRRGKRAADDVIGKRFYISCTDRGESEDDMLALCGSCWTWRKLPDNYFPKIINELSCKEDDFCLSGWGECVQQYRNVDVLRKEGGRWIPTVITTATCCDCRVRAGTEIHSLIIGDKK
ncbi:unnamed protein product [Caenorhabditis angaria]|uniref:Saposin B-type domain-containing protein n=1 Tax=Caenorhabditis angaria TaxID=860376 RepID=A0A9P1J2B5_9PELO|nr:unnamed protein product [Caenorhabditis angaria]